MKGAVFNDLRPSTFLGYSNYRVATNYLERVRYVHAHDGFRLALTELEFSSASANGPAFLLVPGFAQTRMGFLAGELPQVLLERGGRVFLGELRGHGLSAARPDEARNWTLQTHLELDLPAMIERVRERAGVKQVHYFGHSLGGLLGVAALGSPLAPQLASMTTFASPLVLDKHSPLLRLVALIFGPVLARTAHIPMDQFFATFKRELIAGERRHGFISPWIERIALGNAKTAEAAVLADILASSEKESPRVLYELTVMAVRGRAAIAGIDLYQAARAFPRPLACIYGKNDILAPATSLLGIDHGEGPRLLYEVPDALHVDLIVGRHARALADKLWGFLFENVR
jgi:pimeloyl-ACP methyl ester carboxylesterase